MQTCINLDRCSLPQYQTCLFICLWLILTNLHELGLLLPALMSVIPLEDVDDCLRVFLLLGRRDVGCLQQLGPRLGHPGKLACDGIGKSNVFNILFYEIFIADWFGCIISAKTGESECVFFKVCV